MRLFNKHFNFKFIVGISSFIKIIQHSIITRYNLYNYYSTFTLNENFFGGQLGTSRIFLIMVFLIYSVYHFIEFFGGE